MRTKASFVITLIVDPDLGNEVAGRLEVVKNGESFLFNNWAELKTRILENLRDNEVPNHLAVKNQTGEEDQEWK